MPTKKSKPAAAGKPAPKKKPAAASWRRARRVAAAPLGAAIEANKALIFCVLPALNAR